MQRPLYPQPKLITHDSSREEAFLKAYKANYSTLLSIIYYMTGDHALAQDINQETWASAYVNFEIRQFTHIGLLKNRTKQIMIDKYRYNKTRSFITYSDDLDSLPLKYSTKGDDGIECEDAFKSRIRENFKDAFKDEIDFECFWLRFRYGYTLTELSKKLGIAKSTLHDRITRLESDCRRIWEKESS
jgi:RNA polymerase sigma factor (sigma-70 family)